MKKNVESRIVKQKKKNKINDIVSHYDSIQDYLFDYVNFCLTMKFPINENEIEKVLTFYTLKKLEMIEEDEEFLKEES